MPVYDEGMLRFNFAASWTESNVKKLDAHAFYRSRVVRALQHTKAVDFAGIYPPGEIYLVEVKDYRVGDGGPTVQDLAQAVAEKVHDSVAVAVAAAREYNPPGADCLPEIGRTLPDPNHTLRVILWVEDPTSGVNKQKHELSVLTNVLKKKLRWITSKVLAVGLASYAGVPPGLRVTNLPGVGGP